VSASSAGLTNHICADVGSMRIDRYASLKQRSSRISELAVRALATTLTRTFYKALGKGTGTANGGAGRGVEQRSDIPIPGWRDIAWRVFQGIQRDRVLLIAAGITYYAILALFPAVGTVVSLYGLFADPSSITESLKSLPGVLPDGAVQVIGDEAKRIASQGSGTLGFAFVVTLLFSIWSANSATKSLFDALNIIYKQDEKRGFIRLTLSSLGFTIGGIVFVLIGFVGVIGAPMVLGALGIPTASVGWFISLIRWPVLLFVVLFALACLYRYGPSRTEPKWRWVTWGSAAATAIWLGGSILFSWYVASFGIYNRTYGSLGALIGAMVWMWLSSIVILMGAEINVEIEQQAARDSTEDERTPMRMRGTRVADTGPAHH
jgi:membrane protein